MVKYALTYYDKNWKKTIPTKKYDNIVKARAAAYKIVKSGKALPSDNRVYIWTVDKNGKRGEFYVGEVWPAYPGVVYLPIRSNSVISKVNPNGTLGAKVGEVD